MASRKGSKQAKKLQARRAAWTKMSSQSKIGDGHRDINGYPRPGSNKK